MQLFETTRMLDSPRGQPLAFETIRIYDMNHALTPGKSFDLYLNVRGQYFWY